MARGSSLPYPQQPTTCPYPEPHSVHTLVSCHYKILFNIIFILCYASIFQVVPVIHVSAPKYWIHCSHTFVLDAPPTRLGNAFSLNIMEFLCVTEVLQLSFPYCQSTAHNPVLSVSSTQSRTVSQQHTIPYCQSTAHNPDSS